MTRTKKGLLILAFMVTATVFGYWWLPSKHQVNSQPIIIDTLGTHSTPSSNLVESISITEKDEQHFSFTIFKQRAETSSPFWFLFKKQGHISLSIPVNKADEWNITLNDKLGTITYETKTDRSWFKYEDPTNPSSKVIIFSEELTPRSEKAETSK